MTREIARPGFFITFEGIDRSGKTTQAELLVQRLRADGCDVVFTREPGGTAFGREVRRLVLHNTSIVVHPLAEMFLFAADRAQHVAETIRPALSRGKIVISDRFVDSTIAYQGYGRQWNVVQLRVVQDIATGGLRPDITVLVDVDVDTLRRRGGGAPSDRLEGGADAFFDRVRSGFLALSGAEPDRIFRVDGRLTVAELSAQIYAEVHRRMRNDRPGQGNPQGAGAS